MYKLASVALTTVLGVTGIACATPAKADPYVRAAVVLPRVVVAPFGYGPRYYSRGYVYAPYGYWHDHYRWGHGWDRRGFRR